MVCAIIKLCEYIFKNDVDLNTLLFIIEQKEYQYNNLPVKSINCSDQYIPIFDLNSVWINTWTKNWNYSCLNDIPLTKSKYVNYEQILNSLDISAINNSNIFDNKKNLNDTLDLNSTIDFKNSNFYNGKHNLNNSDIDYSINSILVALEE